MGKVYRSRVLPPHLIRFEEVNGFAEYLAKVCPIDLINYQQVGLVSNCRGGRQERTWSDLEV